MIVAGIVIQSELQKLRRMPSQVPPMQKLAQASRQASKPEAAREGDQAVLGDLGQRSGTS